MVNKDRFWHCQLISVKPIQIIIRFGFHVKPMIEDLLTVEILPKTFPTVQEALEFMSLDMKDKLEKGFREVDSSKVTSTMNLG